MSTADVPWNSINDLGDDPRHIRPALAALNQARTRPDAERASTRLLSAIGNDHRGTPHAEAIPATPIIVQLTTSTNTWARWAASEVLIELMTSFVAEVGFESVRLRNGQNFDTTDTIRAIISDSVDQFREHLQTETSPDVKSSLVELIDEITGNRTSNKPLLLLDVDGVLSPFGGGPPPGYRRQNIDGFQVTWSTRHRKWLHDLFGYYEMVWATTWEHKANQAIAPLLGLPQLDVIEFTSERQGDTWKLTDVDAYVGDRPCAWIDDDLFNDAHAWADRRGAPTLLVRPMSSVGMTQIHVSDLEGFGRALQDLQTSDDEDPAAMPSSARISFDW